MFNIQQQKKQDNFFDSPQDYEVLKAFEFLKTQNNRENSEFNINQLHFHNESDTHNSNKQDYKESQQINEIQNVLCSNDKQKTNLNKIYQTGSEIENSQETEVIYQSDESSEISDIKSQKLYNYKDVQNIIQTSKFVENDKIEDLKILEEKQGFEQVQMQKVNQNGSVQSKQLIQFKIEDQIEKNEEENLSIIQDELSQINEKKIGSGFSDFKYNSPPSNLCKRTNLNLRKSLQITQSTSSHQQNYSDKENNNSYKSETGSKRGKYTVFSDSFKKKILSQYYKQSKNPKQLSEEFNIPLKSVKRWIEYGIDGKLEQGRKTLDPQMEDNLIKWIKSSKLQNKLITRNDILQKAKKFSLFPQKFKASKGWLARFIKRTNLKKYISSGYSLNQQQKQQQQQNMQDYNNLDNDTEIKIVKQLNQNGQRNMTLQDQNEYTKKQTLINNKNTDFLFGKQINESKINHREFKCINIR